MFNFSPRGSSNNFLIQNSYEFNNIILAETKESPASIASHSPLLQQNSNIEQNTEHILPFPTWLKPEMIYLKESIEVKGFLGCGEFGVVNKATIRYGPAV